MVNTQLLVYTLKRKGVKKSFVAEQMGITRATFTNKLKGVSPFSLDDVKAIAKALELTNKEVQEIFFAE